MVQVTPLRRHICVLILGGLGLCGPLMLIKLIQDRQDSGRTADAAEFRVSEGVPVVSFDFEKEDLGEWRILGGQWTVEETPGVAGGKRVLVQRGVQNAFNVIIAPTVSLYRDVDISVRFKPISGREDASGGIVFHYLNGRYYVIRANALENNLRLYYYDDERQMLATASVQPPALGRWHTIRVVAAGDRIQGWLDGQLLIDHRDKRLELGMVGLWTKADSVSAFDDLTIRGYWSTISIGS